MKSYTLVADVPPHRSEVNGSDDRADRSRRVLDRLAYLATLEDGWFDGRGLALDKAGLQWLDGQIRHHYVGTDLPLPHLYPLEPSGVIGEWSLERFECAIEIDLEARTGSWVDVELETDEGIDEHVLNLDSVEGWQWLTGRLSELIAKS